MAAIAAPFSAVVVGSPAGAAVIGNDYPAYLRNAPQDSLFDPWKFYNRECTSFVAWRLNSQNGVGFTDYYRGPKWGNASNWGPTARSLGIPVNGTPAVGAVAWESGGDHVAWVAQVNSNSTVTVEEYNEHFDGTYDSRTVSTSAFQYIHIRDITTQSGTPKSALNDVNGDGITDVSIITGANGGSTGSGHAEVHSVLGPLFQQRSDAATPWGYVNNNSSVAFTGNVFGDGRADLCIVTGINGFKTGSGHTEVHCLSAASNFQKRLDVVTPWGYLNTNTSRIFTGNVFGDGRADLCIITGVNGGATGTGHTEVHCLRASTNFQARQDAETPWGYLNTNYAVPFTGNVFGDGRADLCIITGVNGATTGTGHMEVHCLRASTNFQARQDVETPWGYLNTNTAWVLDHTRQLQSS